MEYAKTPNLNLKAHNQYRYQYQMMVYGIKIGNNICLILFSPKKKKHLSHIRNFGNIGIQWQYWYPYFKGMEGTLGCLKIQHNIGERGGFNAPRS